MAEREIIMTPKTNIIVMHEATIAFAEGEHTKGTNPNGCLETGEIFMSLKDTSKKHNCAISDLSRATRGMTTAVKGKHYFLLSKASEHFMEIMARIRYLNAELKEKNQQLKQKDEIIASFQADIDKLKANANDNPSNVQYWKNCYDLLKCSMKQLEDNYTAAINDNDKLKLQLDKAHRELEALKVNPTEISSEDYSEFLEWKKAKEKKAELEAAKSAYAQTIREIEAKNIALEELDTLIRTLEAEV